MNAACKRPVKLMIGGVTRWLDEGFTLVHATAGRKMLNAHN